jgi:tetratricopeptide (TPR) repeat protein
MRFRATSFFVRVAIVAAVSAAGPAWADEPPTALEAKPEGQAPQAKQGEPAPQAKQEEPAQQTPAEMRADLYARLAAAKDSDETAGLVGLLMHAYAESGSDTGDLLLQRARKAIGEEEYSDALKILDATITLLPDWAEGWNARATARYLQDDYDGSMADIAQTLKREPRHIGALMGMATILEARGKREQALQIYERVQAIAPHWRNVEEPIERLKAALAGQEL